MTSFIEDALRIFPAWLVALVLVLGIGSVEPAHADTAADAQLELETKTDALARLISDQYAHPTTFRKVLIGPIYNRTNMDAAVMFSVEGLSGGNTEQEYLAVYISTGEATKSGRFRLVTFAQIGGSDWRYFTDASIDLDTIHLSGIYWKDKDLPRYPTGKISTDYVTDAKGFDEGGIHEKADPSQPPR